jgi:glyoxylase-like metal-dependent hydrolase (beta-lactamase superfamily II)
MVRRTLIAVLIFFGLVTTAASAQTAAPQDFGPQLIAPGVWFLLGDSSKGYSNTVIIELRDCLFVVDANYPGRAHELLAIAHQLSPKPVRWVFDTHHHGDHAYGNSVWTAAGATTIAFHQVTEEMNRWEPTRWRNALPKRPDLQATGETDVQRPEVSIFGDKLVLNDGQREIDMLYLGWGHTRGDGYVWLPHERILATGDAAVNGPRNKLLDADLESWPKALARAIALNPEHVLPGHGDAGGIEILRGQRQFLLDLYAAVEAQADQGKTPAEMQITLPKPDQWWFPESRPDLRKQDIETEYLQITHHAPAGSLPHEWK